MASDVKTPGTGANQIPDQAITVNDEARRDEMSLYRDRFQIMQTFWSSIHDEGLADDKFVAGEQWEEQIRKERQEDRRPMLTYNLLPAFNRQITNRVRQERPALKVTPVEKNRGMDPRIANLAGTKDYSLAEVYAGIFKNIEHVSRADQAYDTAMKHAVDHGFGYFYMIPQWSKLDPFVQELVIHRVKNSYSIMLDPDAQEADYRDMQDAFMFSNINKNTFEAKYPGISYTEFAGTTLGANYEGWYDSEHVRVAQYFFMEHKDDEALMLSNSKIVYRSDAGPILDELEHETGIHIMVNDQGKEMRKAVKRPICNWQKMTADDILEGPIELPFSSVPIYPVFGEEVMVDARMRYESAIRHAKDAQRSYNYWRTAATETVALAPRAPWMATEKQVEGHELEFEQANTRNLPYLFYNHVEGVLPPARVFPASVPAAELQNATQDASDMQAIIGLHDASLGKESNEKSGKAIIARQNAGTTSTFQFPDNLGRALEQCGRNGVEAIPRLYDTKRQARIRLPSGDDDFVMLNEEIEDKDNPGATVLLHDIAFGKYDVALETGPSYATQRQEAADLQMELLKVVGPDMARNIVHLIVQNLGVPGSEEVASVLRKMLPDALKTEDEKMADLPKGVTKDPETEQLMKDGEPWQPPPTLEQEIQMKQQEIDQLEHQAKIDAAKADSAEAAADLAEAELEMAKLQQQGIDQEGQQQANAEMLDGIRETIETTMQQHIDNPNAHDAMDIEAMVANAIVEALQRVRGYVDRQLKAGKFNPADSLGSPPPRSAGDQPATSTSAPGPASPAAPAAVDLNLNLDRSPSHIDHKYDDAGNLVKSIPHYDDSDDEAAA